MIIDIGIMTAEIEIMTGQLVALATATNALLTAVDTSTDSLVALTTATNTLLHTVVTTLSINIYNLLTVTNDLLTEIRNLYQTTLEIPEELTIMTGQLVVLNTTSNNYY